MSRARKPAGRRVARGTGSRVGGDEPSALVKLGKRFARFRRDHPRGTRIPDELREAALALWREEVAPADLYRTCGISSGQVMAWKEAKARRTESQDVRVFSVVDEAPVGRPAPLPAAEPALELRLGPFAVSVRLWGPGTAGRG